MLIVGARDILPHPAEAKKGEIRLVTDQGSDLEGCLLLVADVSLGPNKDHYEIVLPGESETRYVHHDGLDENRIVARSPVHECANRSNAHDVRLYHYSLEKIAEELASSGSLIKEYDRTVLAHQRRPSYPTLDAANGLGEHYRGVTLWFGHGGEDGSVTTCAMGEKIYYALNRVTRPGFWRGFFDTNEKKVARFDKYAAEHGFAMDNIFFRTSEGSTQEELERTQIYIPDGGKHKIYATLREAREELVAKINPILNRNI